MAWSIFMSEDLDSSSQSFYSEIEQPMLINHELGGRYVKILFKFRNGKKVFAIVVSF